jgi:O-antigen/teichoic acid export membrane protein
MKYLTLIYGFCIIIFSLFSYSIIDILSTKDFSAGSVYVPLIACGIGIAQIFGVYIYGLYALEKSAWVIAANIAGAIVNILINITLIPHYGVIVAAWSFLLSNIIQTVILYIFLNKYTPGKINFPLGIFGRMLLPLAGLVGICLVIKETIPNTVIMLILGMLLGFFIYIGLSFITRLLNMEDTYYFKQVIKKIVLRQENA